MRILMTSSRNTNLLAPSYVHYMQRIPGVDVQGIYHPDEFEQYYQRSLLNKILFRIHPAFCLNDINEGIRKTIDSFKPHILWIFKGMEIYPSTLQYAKQKGVKLVNYNPDHPFEFEFRGSGNRYVKESLELYDMHFSYSRRILQQIEQNLGKPAVWLPFGFNLDDEAYRRIGQNEEERKVCFVGYADSNRATAVLQLVEAGLPVDVYGPGWNRFLKNKDGLQVHEPVQGVQFWCTLKRYRVQLNVFRKQNEDSHNMRSFEIPAAGGLMLAPWSSEHAEFFEEEKEAFYYRDSAEMINKAQKILALDAESAQRIKSNARNRSVHSGYSYEHRSAFVVETFKSVFSQTTTGVNYR